MNGIHVKNPFLKKGNKKYWTEKNGVLNFFTFLIQIIIIIYREVQERGAGKMYLAKIYTLKNVHSNFHPLSGDTTMWKASNWQRLQFFSKHTANAVIA